MKNAPFRPFFTAPIKLGLTCLIAACPLTAEIQTATITINPFVVKGTFTETTPLSLNSTDLAYIEGHLTLHCPRNPHSFEATFSGQLVIIDNQSVIKYTLPLEGESGENGTPGALLLGDYTGTLQEAPAFIQPIRLRLFHFPKVLNTQTSFFENLITDEPLIFSGPLTINRTHHTETNENFVSVNWATTLADLPTTLSTGRRTIVDPNHLPEPPSPSESPEPTPTPSPTTLPQPPPAPTISRLLCDLRAEVNATAHITSRILRCSKQGLGSFEFIMNAAGTCVSTDFSPIIPNLWPDNALFCGLVCKPTIVPVQLEYDTSTQLCKGHCPEVPTPGVDFVIDFLYITDNKSQFHPIDFEL